MQIDTGTKCRVCGQIAPVVAEVDYISDTPQQFIPIGPDSSSYYRPVVTSFHCSNPDCGIQYKFPPGKPDAANAILRKVREERELPEISQAESQAEFEKGVEEVRKFFGK